jgi:hypothetical protein
MKRFFFHIITGTSRYEDESGTMLGSLPDVMLHGRTIAKVLARHSAARIRIGQHSRGDDYLEVEDQESKFLITLPFARLLNDTSPVAEQISAPIDLGEYRLARHYARALSA